MDEREYEWEESAAVILLPMKHSKLDENSAMALRHELRRRENIVMVFSYFLDFIFFNKILKKII